MDRILRRPEVESLTGLSRSTIYAMISEGSFPSPLKIGKRAVGWQDSDLSSWISSRQRNNTKDGGEA